MKNYIELRNSCLKGETFVVTRKKELHATAREFILHAVRTYASETGSHAKDAKTGIRVALDYNKQYAPFVRSAMCKVRGNVKWSYTSSNDVTYELLKDKSKEPEQMELVISWLIAQLDNVDDMAKVSKVEKTEQEKLETKAKTLLTSFSNVSSNAALFKALIAQASTREDKDTVKDLLESLLKALA